MDWNNVLNWRLLSGSHKFPGPDGGTCINEAAIVAAGFHYKAVWSADDCPPCFSRVLSAYAIIMNDRIPNDLRQELLMPFVTRLAGTADSPEIERQRFDYLMLGLMRSLAIIFRGWKAGLANQCNRIASYDEAIAAVNGVARDRDLDVTRPRALDLALARALALPLDLARALDLALALDNSLFLVLALARARALALARTPARTPGLARALARALARQHVALLDGAMKIGKQAKPPEAAIVCDRMAAIRADRQCLL